jgi:cell division septum initiation protein DivIVA
MNTNEKNLKLEEEIKELKNQLAMKTNKVKELEYAFENQKPKKDTEDEAHKILVSLMNHEANEFIGTLDDLLTGYMCFDPAADDSNERNEKVCCVNVLKYHINKVSFYLQTTKKTDW